MQTFDPTVYLNEIRQKIDGMTKQRALEFLDQSINTAKGKIEYHKAERAKAGKDEEEVLKLETVNFQKFGTFYPAFYEPQKIEVLEGEREKLLERNPDLVRVQEKVSVKEGFSEARQVLALYYLINSLGVDFASVDKSSLARFTRFLTNKETKGEIKNTGTYKRWIRMFTKSEKQAKKDLEFVKAQFQSIGLQKIVQEIQGDLDNAG